MKGHLGAFLLGLLVLWAALAFIGWILWRSLRNSEDPARLIAKWILTLVLAGIALSVAAGSRLDDMGSAFIIPITGAICGVMLGIVWGSSIGELLASPLVSLMDGGAPEGKLTPLYSVAETKRKQGRFSEAIQELRKQLELFPLDFKAWMLVAEIQGENLLENATAQLTIEEIIGQPGRTPEQIAYALTRSAELHLKLASDRDAASAAFERIRALFPDTELAQLAAQRIAHLTPAEMLAQKQGQGPAPLKITQHTEKLGLEGKVVEAKGIDPALIAANLVKHLEIHPYDNEAREQLAMLYAEHYERLDLALEQLNQLVSSPNQQQKHTVHWLNLMADLCIRYGGNPENARAVLERIILLYPKSAAAESAAKRIAFLKLEMRQKEATRVVKLGSYEKNLGLK